MTQERLVVHSCSRTFNNRGWYNQPVFQLPVDAAPADIGNRLRDALNASVWDSRIDDSLLVPHPIVIKSGFKSWDSLERNSRLVNIGTDKELILMSPCRAARRGEGKGFIGLDATITVHWTASDADVGHALLSACRQAVGMNER